MDSWEFGRTVRSWRDRVRPTSVGVPVGGRRRAAGLRREELAGLAGISVDYSIWRHLVGPGSRALTTPEQQAELEAGLVADLRMTAARYPNDQRLKQLIRELAEQSPRFEKLWASGAPEARQDYGRHKVIDHPDVGHIALECDILVVAADDLRIMTYTAEPDNDDGERLALAVGLGTQSLVD